MSMPKLRFKEFNDSWEENRIGEITLKVGSGSTPLGGEKVYQSSGIPFIRSQNVNNERLSFNDIAYISDEINSQMKGSVVKPNDILLNITGASIGRSCVVPTDFETGNVNQHVCIIRLKNDYSSRFLQPYLSSSRGQKSILSTQVGSGREGLNFEAIRSFKVFIPKIEEQTKIANFLTAVDEKITQLTQKCDLLAQYKKGVMQQIFSQELRFKDDDGRDFPDWEEKKLGEVSKNIMYGMNAAATAFDGKNKYIRITDIDDENRTFLPNPLTSPNGVIEGKFKLMDGDIVFTRTGASTGKAYLYNPKDGDLFFAGFLVKFSITECNPYFVFLQTLTESYSSWVNVMSMRSGQPGINAEEYKEFKFFAPHIQEQTKIANFIAAIDNKINNAQAQLAAVKQYKQGLLQQMFV